MAPFRRKCAGIFCLSTERHAGELLRIEHSPCTLKSCVPLRLLDSVSGISGHCGLAACSCHLLLIHVTCPLCPQADQPLAALSKPYVPPPYLQEPAFVSRSFPKN